MNRRTFLQTGSVAFAVRSPLGKSSIGETLRRGMIWLGESVPVPLISEKRESDIAGPFQPSQQASLVDLHAAFRKEFTLPNAPRSAKLHLFAYTRYRLYINGTYVGRGPSRFQNQRPEYDTINIHLLLRAGRNVVAVLVHRDAPTGRIMLHDPGFAALLEWDAEGRGASNRIVTDPTWRAESERSFGSRDAAWSSITETVDAARMADWTSPGFDASDWAAAVPVSFDPSFTLAPRTTPLQRETHREWRPSVAVVPTATLSAPAQVTFDLDEIIQGYHILELEAEAGSVLQLHYQLPGGSQSGESTYIARGGAQRYIGGDTFAFSRLMVEVKHGAVRLTAAKAVEVRYPFERVGRFESSDPFLNRLWAICARSLEVLSEDAYVDCADRERVEWTDNSPPAFGSTRVMMAGLNLDGSRRWSDARLLKALLRRIALTQGPDGQIKAHSCSDRWDIHAVMEDRSCDWVLLLGQYYDSTGDLALVEELWPALTRLLTWFLAQRTARGLVQAREWEVWDNPLRYQVCEGAGLNAFVFQALRTASRLGERSGEHAAAQRFSTAADTLAQAFNALLWDDSEGAYYGALFGPGSKRNVQLNGTMFTGPIVNGHYRPTLQAALFALESGIVPASRHASVVRWMLSHQSEAVGPMSHNFLFKALYNLHDEKADARVLELMRAGWKNQVESPWQTTWEDLGDHGGSKIHTYGMVPGYFLSAYVLGVHLDGPVSNARLLIEPRPGGLLHAGGVVVTELGPVPLQWMTSVDGSMSTSFTVPANASAKVRLRQRNGGRTLLVDGQKREASIEDPYLAVSVAAGAHVVQHLNSPAL